MPQDPQNAAPEAASAPDGALCLTCQNYENATCPRFLSMVEATASPHPLVTACGIYDPIPTTTKGH